MENIEILEKEIDEVDSFIASLGEEGEAYVTRLRDLNIKLEIPDARVPHQAYYDCLTNTFFCQTGLPLPIRFNLRTHEGAHGLQFNAVTDVTEAINNLTTYNFSGPFISPVDLVIVRELAEVPAYAIQAYFNAIAATKHDDQSFITCFEDDEGIADFVTLQLALSEQNASPEEVKTKVAQEFLSCTMPWPFTDSKTTTQKDMLNLLALMSYMKIAEEFSGKIRRENFISIPEETLGALLNAALPISCTQTILEEYRKPLALTSINHEFLSDIKPHLK